MTSTPDEVADEAYERLALPYNGVVAVGVDPDGRHLRAEVWGHGVPLADRYPLFVAVP